MTSSAPVIMFVKCSQACGQNNQDVIDRLESADQKKIRKAGWDIAIRSALFDCMSADYYYTFKKDYGND